MSNGNYGNYLKIKKERQQILLNHLWMVFNKKSSFYSDPTSNIAIT
jgi:hypothetical protein